MKHYKTLVILAISCVIMNLFCCIVYLIEHKTILTVLYGLCTILWMISAFLWYQTFKNKKGTDNNDNRS